MHRGFHRPLRVSLAYSLADQSQSDDLVHHPLIQMLDAVERRGSISAAARTLGFSYRHVWGELKRWEARFERELIVWEKGQKAQLTTFGQKLLWAERQVQSRLSPQIAALRADLERVFGTAFDDDAHVVSIPASHDDALARFRDTAVERGLHLELRFCGSLEALARYSDARSQLAGFHVPRSRHDLQGTIRRLKEAMRKSAAGADGLLIPFARRTQGLIVEANNPLGLKGLPDLLNGTIRFVNRLPGAATRLFLDAWLDDHGVSADSIQGYRFEEPSHAAVAQAVWSGAAEAGLGLESAARDRGLGFVPLFDEDYWIVCREQELATPGVEKLIAMLAENDWTDRLDGYEGYERPCPELEASRLSELLA